MTHWRAPSASAAEYAYQDYRQRIRSGDLLAWQGSGWLSRLVRLRTRSPWTHVGVAWRVGGRVLVLESLEGIGVRIAPLTQAGYLPAWHIATNATWTDLVEQYALSMVDKPYSYWDLLRGVVGLGPSHGRGLVCSEYAADVLAAAKVVEPEYIPASPAELVNRFLMRRYVARKMVAA